MKKYLSIIVPIYNARKYIEKFLESINNQTSNSFEVVFVDDRSSDDTHEFLKEWLEKNASFDYQLIMNKKNSGPGFSRNKGIELARGDYLSFSDADDYLSCEFVEKSLSLVEKCNVDLIMYDYFMVKDEVLTPQKSCLVNEYGKVSPMDALALSRGMCWARVYKKSIIIENKIKFPNIIRSEDLVFIKKYVSVCKNILYDNAYMYYYVQNRGSIMHSLKTMHVENNVRAFNEIKKIGNNEAVEMIFIREYLYLNTQIMVMKKYKFNTIRKFIGDSSKMYPQWYKNKYIKYQPFYLKVMFVLVRFRMLILLKLAFLLKEKRV